MVYKKRTFFLGIFIFLIPFLGVTSFWKKTFTVLSGIALVTMSVKITLPKRSQKQKIKKEKITPIFVENSPVVSRPIGIDSVVPRTRVRHSKPIEKTLEKENDILPNQ